MKVGELLVELVVQAAKGNQAAVKAATDTFKKVSDEARKTFRDTDRASKESADKMSRNVRGGADKIKLDIQNLSGAVKLSLQDAFSPDSLPIDGINRKVALLAEDTRKAFDNIERLASSAGQKLQDSGRRIEGVGKSMTKWITAPVAGAATAVAGLTAGLGFKRLVGIDTARGQFRGLGYDADAVMKQVDAGVTGTSLSMAEGAASAVSILATGAVPLEDLEAQIKRVANVSAAYGVDANHANYLLNNVLTKQKVTWGDLSQMQQNQIPIVSQLADMYGVSGEELQKMVQQGKVSIEDLNRALDTNAGAAAEEYAKTWAGVTSNIRANLGRIGAAFLGEAFETIKTEAGSLLEFLRSEDLGEWARDAGARFGEGLNRMIESIRDLHAAWQNLSPTTQKAIGIFAGIAVATGPALIGIGKVLVAFGNISKGVGAVAGGVSKAAGTIGKMAGSTSTFARMGTSAVGGVGKAFSGLFGLLRAHPVIAIVTAIVGALVWFFTKTETGRAIVERVWNAIKSVIGAVGDWITGTAMPALAGAWDTVKAVWGTVVDWFDSTIVQPITALFDLIGGWWTDTLMPALSSGWDMVLTAAEPFISWLEEHVWPVIQSIIDLGQALGDRWSQIWGFLTDLAANFSDKVGEIAAAISGWLGPAFEWIGDAFASAVDWMAEKWNTISGLLDAFGAWVMEKIGPAIQWLRDLFGPAIDWISEKWGTVTDWLGTAWDAVMVVIGEAWSLLWAQISTIWEGVGAVLIQVLITAWENVKTIFVFLWDTMVAVVEGALAVIKGIIDTVTAIIRGDWEGAWEAIKGVFQTVWDTIKTVVTNAINAVRSILQNVLNGIRNIIRTALDTVLNLFRNVWNSVNNVTRGTLDKVVNFVKGIPGKILSGLNALTNLGAKAAEWFGKFLTGAREKLGDAVAFAKDIPNKILNALGNVGNLLLNAGKSLLGGFTKGITDGFNKARNAVSNGLTKIRNFFPFSPAKEGPFSGLGYTTFSGAQMMKDYGEGMTKGARDAVAAGKRAQEAIARSFGTVQNFTAAHPMTVATPTVPSARRGTYSAAMAPSSPVSTTTIGNVTIEVHADDLQEAADMVEMLKDLPRLIRQGSKVRVG